VKNKLLRYLLVLVIVLLAFLLAELFDPSDSIEIELFAQDEQNLAKM
jgi:hypothetical protein